MECLGKYYAGIGSRETPFEVLNEMRRIASFLEGRGYTLRSGGARGADWAFEVGTDRADIWIPYDLPSRVTNPKHRKIQVSETDDEAYKSVVKYHPSPYSLSTVGSIIMARNYRQVIGIEPEPNSEFVVCWTKDGKDSGGTGQAIRIATDFGIPVYNLFFEDHLHALYSALTLKELFDE